MPLDLNSLIPWYVKLGAGTIVVALIFYGGWHYGSQNVQTSWDKANAAAIVVADKTRAANQRAADVVSKTVETKIDQYSQEITNLNQELNDASIQLSVCGKQPLPDSGVQLYRSSITVNQSGSPSKRNGAM